MLILLPPSRLKCERYTADILFSHQALASSAGETKYVCKEFSNRVVHSCIESRLIAGDPKLRLGCAIE